MTFLSAEFWDYQGSKQGGNGPTGLCKENVSNLLAKFRESRAFLLHQAGGNEAEVKQKCEIRETL